MINKLNFEGFLEFNQGIYDFVNKYNKIVQTSSQDGYENLLLNPELNQTIKIAGTGVEFDLNYYVIAGWNSEYNPSVNLKKEVLLADFISATDSPESLAILNNTKTFKLNLNSTTKKIYTKTNFQIQPKSSYIFAIEYYTEDVTLKDLVVETASISNNSSFVDLAFAEIGYLQNPETSLYISHLNKVAISENKFLQYFVIKNDDGTDLTANLREIKFTIKASSSTSNYIMITKCNFFKGDLPLIGMVKQNNNLIRYINGKVQYFTNGLVENGYRDLISKNLVYIGEDEQYKTISEAIEKEPDMSSKVAFLTSSIVEDVANLYLPRVVYGNNNKIIFGRNEMTVRIEQGSIINDVLFSKSDVTYSDCSVVFAGGFIKANNISYVMDDDRVFVDSEFNSSFFKFDYCYDSSFIGFNMISLTNNLIEKAILIDGCSNCVFRIGRIENIGKNVGGDEYATGVYLNDSNYNNIKLDYLSISDLILPNKIIKGVDSVNSHYNDVIVNNIVEN